LVNSQRESREVLEQRVIGGKERKGRRRTLKKKIQKEKLNMIPKKTH